MVRWGGDVVEGMALCRVGGQQDLSGVLTPSPIGDGRM